MHCHRCGRQIDASLLFCTFCGAKQMPIAGAQSQTHDEEMMHEWSDIDASLPMSEEIIPEYDNNDFDEDSLIFNSYEDGWKPRRWLPIAISLLSVLLLVGVIIGIWVQFFSKKKDDVEFSEQTKVTYNIKFSQQVKEQKTTTTQSVESETTFRELTSEITSMTSTPTQSATHTESHTLETTSLHTVEVVIVTEPTTATTKPTETETKPPKTDAKPTGTATKPTGKVTIPVKTVPFPVPTSGVYPVTSSKGVSEQPTTSLDVTVTVPLPSTPPSPDEEEPDTTASQSRGSLSIDNVHMDMWPGVRLHFSYVPPLTFPVSQPDALSPAPTTTDISSPPTTTVGELDDLTDVSSIPPPFDIRFLSIYESVKEDGVWIKQFVAEEKSNSKLMVIAENSRKITETVSIGALRSSLNNLIGNMDFVADESGRSGDALGIMQFSDSATLLTPVTNTEQEVLDALDELAVGTDHSLLWDSLYLALGETPDHGALLLITTGEDTGSQQNSLYVNVRAQSKGIPVYVVFIKTEGSDLLGQKEAYFRQFSEITGGCCYVIDATDPKTDVIAGVEMALVAAYGGDRQNRFVFYHSTMDAEVATRFVKIVYAPEGQQAIESEIVSYSIPADTNDSRPETRHKTPCRQRRVSSNRRGREQDS